jgi:hypothetical protein
MFTVITYFKVRILKGRERRRDILLFNRIHSYNKNTMSWCPKCGVKYQAGYNICADCNELLQQTPPQQENLPIPVSGLISIFMLENEVQGAVLKSVLEEQGIESVIRDFIISQHQLPEMGQNAWGEILVREADAEDAKFIITEYLNTLDTEISQDEEEEDGDDEDYSI